MSSDPRLESGARVRHYKGGEYVVAGEATHTENSEPLVLYQDADGASWARPKSRFLGFVITLGGQKVARFVLAAAPSVAEEAPSEPTCPFGDPTCPCPDGDPCHYVDLPGSPAMTPPRPPAETAPTWSELGATWLEETKQWRWMDANDRFPLACAWASHDAPGEWAFWFAKNSLRCRSHSESDARRFVAGCQAARALASVAPPEPEISREDSDAASPTEGAS